MFFTYIKVTSVPSTPPDIAQRMLFLHVTSMLAHLIYLLRSCNFFYTFCICVRFFRYPNVWQTTPTNAETGLALPLLALQNVFWELGLDRPPQTVLRGVDPPGQAEAAEQDTCIKLHPHLSGLCSHGLCSEPSGIQPWCILLFLGSGRRDDGLYVHSPASGMAGREQNLQTWSSAS